MRRLLPWLTHHLQTPFVVLILGVMVYVLWQSQSFSLGARLFPQVVASAGILLALAELLRQFLRRGAREEQDFTDLASEEDSVAYYGRGMLFFGWLVVFVVLLFLVGPIIAAGMYVLLLLTVQFRSPWRVVVALSLGLMALIWVLGVVLQLRWPASLLSGLI